MAVFHLFSDTKGACPTGAIGRTIQLEDTSAAGTIRIVSVKGDEEIAFKKQKTIITRVTVSQQGNYQFLHTLGNDVYIYVFGDRIGEIAVSGLSFPMDCDKIGGKIGGELIFDWYKKNRVAARPNPVTITIGTKTIIDGFVTAFTLDVVDPKTGIMQWNMQMVVLPEK